MIAYHQSERLAAAALTDLAAAHPAMVPLANAYAARLLREEGGCNHGHVHAVLTFLKNDTISTAADEIAAKRKIPSWQAEGTLITALNSAPDLFHAHRDLLLKKGVVSIGGQFASLGESVHQAQFCHAVGQISPCLRPVAENIFCAARARRPGKERVPERLLPFVAAQLMPIGTERMAAINALAVTIPRRAYADSMAQAASHIVRSADFCGVMVPAYHLERAPRSAAPAAPRSARRDHEKSTTPAMQGFAGRIVTGFRAVEKQVLGLIQAA